MFKKRSRPAAVREKTPDTGADEVVSAATSAPDTGDEREDTPEGQSIEQMILRRKLRRGQQGIDLEKFNRGEARKRPKDTVADMDAYGLQSAGGLSHSASSSSKPRADAGDDEGEQLARKVRQNNFTQQTNALDVNKHMMAFIETEMAKKKGIAEGSAEARELDPQTQLYDLADRYKVEGVQVGEDEEGNVTNSLGMLSAIPEMDLGMENRLRNIEETEKAKRELMEKRAQEQRRTDDDPLASTRFFRGQQREVDIQREMKKARREAAGLEPYQHKERAPKAEMASDEVVMERFKKRMRR